MNDPRVEAASGGISKRMDRLPVRFGELQPRAYPYLAEAALAAADAADREQGIHRVKVDDETVEKVAEAIHGSSPASYETHWDDLVTPVKKFRRDQARAVLAALTGAES